MTEPRSFGRMRVIKEKLPMIFSTAGLVDELGLSRAGLSSMNTFVKERVDQAVHGVIRVLRRDIGDIPADLAQVTAAKMLSTNASSSSSAKVIKTHLPRACNREQDGDLFLRYFHVSPAVIQHRLERGLRTQKVVELRCTDPITALLELLFDSDHVHDESNYLWNFEYTVDDNGERTYGELNTGNRWREAELFAGATRPLFDYNMMPIVAWTDGATPDSKRSTMIKPLVVTCGNLVGRVSRTNQGKAFLGFFNKLKVCCATCCQRILHIY
jgi:hypothetical protein